MIVPALDVNEISRDEFVLRVLEDELSKGAVSAEDKNLVTCPNLSSVKENADRRRLIIRTNGAIGDQLETVPFRRYYWADIDVEAFLQLSWCPKGPDQEPDSVEKLTGGSRQVRQMLRALKAGVQPERDLAGFLCGPVPVGNAKRLFVFKRGVIQHLIDGNHRAGAILRELQLGSTDTIFPVRSYTAEV